MIVNQMSASPAHSVNGQQSALFVSKPSQSDMKLIEKK
jgi:hypothetical protein